MPRKEMHPNFQKKEVYELDCRFCASRICDRGMRAILLANTKVELFSTDSPPKESIDRVDESYCTETCSCLVQDTACLGCGNVVGYNVVQPCRKCLRSCNNGHLWMYYSDTVDVTHRLDRSGNDVLVWAKLLEEDTTNSNDEDEEFCIR